MLLLKRKQEEKTEDQEKFSYTKKYIADELELIQDQQENIIEMAEEIETALSQTEKMKELIKLVKKIDKTVLEENVGGKRKQESRMINLIEDVKRLIAQQRYEDIERLMLQVHQESQLKIRLSQEELNNLRSIMAELVELYKKAAGLCRLYTLVYEQIKKIYDQCAQELGIETAEEEELSRAGPYTEKIH